MITKIDYLELLSYVINTIRETYAYDYLPLAEDELSLVSVIPDLDHSLRSDKLKLELLVKRLCEVYSTIRLFEELYLIKSDEQELNIIKSDAKSFVNSLLDNLDLPHENK